MTGTGNQKNSERKSLRNVAGRKAIVFGGNSGIGLAIAEQLAALGCGVLAVSRKSEVDVDGGWLLS